MLIDRRDIINKTILRSIRKYFRKQFARDFAQPRFNSIIKRAQSFTNCLESFVTTMCADSLQAANNDFEKYFEELSQYIEVIGRVINNKLYSKAVLIDEGQHNDHVICSFAAMFNDWCLNYSHNKFEEIVASDSFAKLFSIFIKTKSDDFLSSIDAINNNMRSYERAFNQLKLIVCHKSRCFVS